MRDAEYERMLQAAERGDDSFPSEMQFRLSERARLRRQRDIWDYEAPIESGWDRENAAMDERSGR